MNDDFYQRAARDLPNFPRPVIELWFEHAIQERWPPPLDPNGFPIGKWGQVLGERRPFAFWHTVTWRLERLPLTSASLEPFTGSMVDKLRIAFQFGLPHPPGIPIANASARIRGFVSILHETRRLPHPPLLLRADPWFEVLDGNHRLAALFHAQANAIPVEPQHEALIATPPG